MTDDELRDLARADRRAALNAIDSGGDLEIVRRRIAAGDGGTEVLDHGAGPRPRSMLWYGAAAAAVVGMLLAGIVTFSQDDRAVLRTVTPETIPTTVPSPTVPETTVSETTAPDTTVLETAVTTSVAPAVPLIQAIAVNAAAPPPLITPDPFVSVPLEPNPGGNPISVAIGENLIAVSQLTADFVTLIPYGPDVEVSGSTRRLPLEEQLYSIVLGPGEVLYGFGDIKFEGSTAVPTFRYVAVAISGDRAGEVIAESDLGANTYLELPPGAFGHGPEGVVDRDRMVNTTVREYVDAEGRPTDWIGTDPPLLIMDRSLGEDVRVSVDGSERAWDLVIVKSPTTGGTYFGPSPPAPTSGGRVIYSDTIGDDLTPGQDFGPSQMPVIAILEPDGSGRWVRLPDDWSVAASDVWGTVLMRTSGDSVELALLDDALAEIWPGRVERDTSGSAWTLTAPGLNDFIAAAGPAWAADPLAFGDEIAPQAEANERVEVAWDGAAGALTITTSNLADDSAFASRWTILLQLNSDGLYRFVSGTSTQQCQPGRGHQDFRPEPCI